MMASSLVAAPLASTPPQHTPGRGSRRNSIGGVLNFRSATPSSDDASGSVSRGSSSFIGESGSWRSLARSSASAARATPVRPIPKSDSFVKVEGFDTAHASPSSAGASDSLSHSIRSASSLLSRQLSTETLTTLHRPSPSSPPPASLAHSLEQHCGLRGPIPRPAALPRRPSVPDNLLGQLQARLPVFSEALVVRAFNIARLAHDGRHEGANGEPAFARCAGSASILAELGADEVAVAGALLHDALDRTMLLEGQLRAMLGSDETLDLIKKVSHLGYATQKFRASAPGVDAAANADPDGGASRLVDLMVAHGPPRALLVRLAVALHEARTLDARLAPGSTSASSPSAVASRAASRLRAAQDALALWAPLANRLGVWVVKAELEDRAFRALRPADYAELRERLERVQQPTALVSLVEVLRSELQAAGVQYLDLSGRPKHLYGVWKKMETKGYAADRVQDVRGLRVIVRTREDCYRAMRAVETAWKLAGPAKNYIKVPKANGYQSLHCVADPGDGHRVEVQIRTDKMHYLAEYGADAAHWRYKEGAGASEGRAAASGAEANWAKFVTSQAVARDQKCRPSGSPEGDHSLRCILSSMDDSAAAAAAASSAAASSPPSASGRSFAEYIESTGQRPAPPAELRVLVAVVVGGAFSVVDLPAGTTLGQLLRSCGTPELHPTHLHAVVNRQVETDPAALLRAGDVVELYAEPAAPSLPAPAPGVLLVVPSPTGQSQQRQRGNMLPLGSLGRKFGARARSELPS